MAQLDRALDSDSKGCGFKSRQVLQIKKDRKGPFLFGCIIEWDLNMEKICLQIKDFQKVLPKLFGIRKSNGTILYFDFSQNILSEVCFDAGRTGGNPAPIARLMVLLFCFYKDFRDALLKKTSRTDLSF